jgi:glycosyltransferase involved in cell wall biosynthesis
MPDDRALGMKSAMQCTVPFVSVVVPTYNRAQLLRDCLKSLLVQDYPRDQYEIIVVDDGSEDETARLVASLCEHSNRLSVRCCRQRLGINRARNEGIIASRGEVVGIVDDDEIAPVGLVSEAVRLLVKNPGTTAVGGWYRVRTEVPRPAFVCRRCLENYNGTQYPGGNEQSTEVTDLPGGCLFAWREAFRVYGPFDDTLSGPGDDSEWCARVRRQGGRFVMGRDVWVWHRVLPGDLRLRRIWNKCGRSAGHSAKALMVMGWNGSWLREVEQGVRFLAHGLRHGCVVGLLRGAGHIALAWRWMHMRRRPNPSERRSA